MKQKNTVRKHMIPEKMKYNIRENVFDDLMEHSEEERRRKIEAFIYNLERLLNMEPGRKDEI